LADPKAGLALFARVPIKKGQFIIATRYLFEINERWTIDVSSRRNRARYIG
jgi:hypothetical protein